MGSYGISRHDVFVEAQFFMRHPERKTHELRKMKYWHVQFYAGILLDFFLETIQHCVTERARRHHRLRAISFG